MFWNKTRGFSARALWAGAFALVAGLVGGLSLYDGLALADNAASDSAGAVDLRVAVDEKYVARCSNGHLVLFPDNNPGLVSDCASLLAAQDDLVGEDGIGYGWGRERITEWEGVEISLVDGESIYRVTELRVENVWTSGGSWRYRFTGTLPAALGNLDKLVSLRLNAQHRGALPEAWGALRNLEILHVGSSLTTGAIPSSFGQMRNLRELHLSNKDLVGVIPASLGNLSRLEGLWLHDNALVGSIPRELGDLSSLRSLRLDQNGLTGDIPSELGDLRELDRLWLNDNALSGTIPASFGNMRSLTGLYLRDNRLTGSIPQELGRLDKLADLTLGGNSFSGCIPSALRDLLDTYEKRAGIGLPFCDVADEPPAPTATAAASATPISTGTPQPTATPVATATPTPTGTPVPAHIQYSRVVHRLAAFEKLLNVLFARLTTLENAFAALASATPAPTATPTVTPTATIGPVATSTGVATAIAADCVKRIGGDSSVGGEWTSACVSANSPYGRVYYSRFYAFTLLAPGDAIITLRSDDVTPYIYLLEGVGRDGSTIAEGGGAGVNVAVLMASLEAGIYTIEATSSNAERRGEFQLEIEFP